MLYMRAPWLLESARSAHRVEETRNGMWLKDGCLARPLFRGLFILGHLAKTLERSTGRDSRNVEPEGRKKSPHVLVQNEGCRRLTDLGEPGLQ